MTITLILKRLARAWRSSAMLLLAVSLLTGFFALGPFYIRAVTEVGLRFELDNAAPEDLQIQLILDNEPLSPDALNVVSEELGDLAVGYQYMVRADYNAPQTQGGIDVEGLATGGYLFQYGRPAGPDAERSAHAFQPFAFAEMDTLLMLIAGQWPQRLPPPEAVSTAGLSDAEQQARQIGPYTRGQVEVVITPTVAERSGLQLGSRLVLGTIQPNGSGAVATVIVVGIVEPQNPLDPFWQGNRMFTEGLDVPIDFNETRYDFGMATVPSAYTDWLQPVTPGDSFLYLIKVNPDAISAAEIGAINARLSTLGSRLNAYHPGVTVLSDLSGILARYAGDVDDTEGPIILLSGAILLLMLYHLVTTVALVLAQQETEWSTLVSRGGSVPQLVVMQAITVGLIGLIGAAAGPLLSIVFMEGLERFGPLATALGGRSLGSTGVPLLSRTLSGSAGLAAMVVLTLPAIRAARHSLHHVKQRISRPPTRPAWARYRLDGVLLIVGGGLILRLYYLVGGDFSDLLRQLVMEPRAVVALIADNLTASGGLNDPFNVLAPALLLTGAALLWLRFFPGLMEQIARLMQRSPHLTTPLALWNVARDPGHYAQLVLLLIGTLALGTASLGLTETRDVGAWRTARFETGGSVRVTINPATLNSDTVRWDRLPGVSAALPLMHVTGDPGAVTTKDVHLIGLDPALARAQFGELAPAAAPLAEFETPPAPGLELPLGAVKLSVQVYSLPAALSGAPDVTVGLTAYVQDAVGVPFRIRLTPPSSSAPIPGADSDPLLTIPTPTEQWLTFVGTLPTTGRTPYRLMRMGLTSTQGNIDAFQHTLYLDRIAIQNNMGTSITLDSFETPDNAWTAATHTNPYAAAWKAPDSSTAGIQNVFPIRLSGPESAIEGPGVLRVDYWIGRSGRQRTEPSIAVNKPTSARIPIIINPAFADIFAGTRAFRTAADAPLTIGDEKNIMLNLGTGTVEIGYRVVGIVDDFPALSAKDPIMIAPIGLIEPLINQVAAINQFFTDNEIWLDLPAREPSDALKAELAGLGSGVQNVTYAWVRYGEIQREPLPSAVAGMLFAGFWVSLLLSLLDFAFYLVVTARQRLYTFAVLRSLGWNAGHIWSLLLAEQITLVAPALIAGSLIGAGLAYLLLPFLALAGSEALRIPWLSVFGLLGVLIVSFSVLMGLAAVYLRRMSVNQVLRLGEE